jgi:hypothetical protein
MGLQKKFVGQTHKKRPDELGVIVEVGVGRQHRLTVPALLQKDPVVLKRQPHKISGETFIYSIKLASSI